MFYASGQGVGQAGYAHVSLSTIYVRISHLYLCPLFVSVADRNELRLSVVLAVVVIFLLLILLLFAKSICPLLFANFLALSRCRFATLEKRRRG